MILPHEHVFVDLRTSDKPGYGEAEADDVVSPDGAARSRRIKALGFTALVECSTGGVGRRADLDRAVSEATGFPIVVPTGNLPRAVGAAVRAQCRERTSSPRG